MVRGSAEPWAETRAASSAGAAGLRSSSRLNVLGQSSVGVINLSITSYHPACQTSPRPGPSPAPRAGGGGGGEKRESKTEKPAASNSAPAPCRPPGQGGSRGWVPSHRLCAQERRRRRFSQPGAGRSPSRLHNRKCPLAWLFDSCHSPRAQGTLSLCL